METKEYLVVSWAVPRASSRVTQVELLHNLETGGGEKTLMVWSEGPLIVKHESHR